MWDVYAGFTQSLTITNCSSKSFGTHLPFLFFMTLPQLSLPMLCLLLYSFRLHKSVPGTPLHHGEDIAALSISALKMAPRTSSTCRRPSEAFLQAPVNVPYVCYLGVMKIVASPAVKGFWEPANLFPQ